MFKKFIKQLFLFLLVFNGYVLSSDEKIVFIDTEPIQTNPYKFSCLWCVDQDMLISLMESLMNGSIVVCKGSNDIRFSNYQDDQIIYTKSTKEAYCVLKKLRSLIYDSLKNGKELGFYPSLKLYIQSIRFFDFINGLDLVKRDSDVFKLLARGLRRNILNNLKHIKDDIHLNNIIKYSTYLGFISFEKDFDQLILDIQNSNLENNNLLGTSVKKRRLKELEKFEKFKSWEESFYKAKLDKLMKPEIIMVILLHMRSGVDNNHID